MHRPTSGTSDYTEYTDAYDSLLRELRRPSSIISITVDDAGNYIDPRQYIVGSNNFKKLSQEVRIASPQDNRFRVIVGAILPATDQRHLPGLPGRQSRRRSLRQRPSRAPVADQAGTHGQGLCVVRRSELRRHAANHPDRRRAIVQVRQYVCSASPASVAIPHGGAGPASAAAECRGSYRHGRRAVFRERIGALDRDRYGCFAPGAFRAPLAPMSASSRTARS